MVKEYAETGNCKKVNIVGIGRYRPAFGDFGILLLLDNQFQSKYHSINRCPLLLQGKSFGSGAVCSDPVLFIKYVWRFPDWLFEKC